MALTERASAKVNLFLHVGRPGADGYHDISSLMVFADVGDEVTLEPGGSGFSLTGSFAAGLGAEGDNLVVRARDLFVARFGDTDTAVGLRLEKRLPIAAGLGGGSADAAATLRLLAAARDLAAEARLPSGALGEIARALGADVAACLASASVIAEGRGDVLLSPPPLPVLDAVLVNPLAPSPTAAVYRAFDDDGRWGELARVEAGCLETTADVARWLGETRNDLQHPATRLSPQIGDVLDCLAASELSLIARMSGSGATCFALCSGGETAAALAAHVASRRPEWWVTTCRLG